MSATLLFAALLGSSPAEILDDFSSISHYKAIAAEGVTLHLGQDAGHAGKALRIDVNFNGHGGYVLAERAFYRKLPANYEFSYWLKADLPDNNMEFKLMDPSGQYTYWHQRPGFHWPSAWTHIVIRKRQVHFAWGPKEQPLTETGMLQFGVGAATGGKGSILISDFQFKELPEFAPFTGKVQLKSQSGDAMGLSAGRGPWRASKGSLDADLGDVCEFGGLVLEWMPTAFPRHYKVLASDDGSKWHEIASNREGRGGTEIVFTPDGSGRYLRLECEDGPVALRKIRVLPVGAADSPNSRLSTYATELPAGLYPRHLLNQQGFWTIVGSNGGANEGAISEDGQVEIGKTLPSIDPFVVMQGGSTLSWANTEHKLSLADGYIPVARVLRKGPLDLAIESFATNDGSESLYADYRLTNRTSASQKGSLVLAVRPIQVNPSWQALNNVGGVSRIKDLAVSSRRIEINREHLLDFSEPATRFGASAFSDGEVGRRLAAGRPITSPSVRDTDELASGALCYDYRLEPGETKRVVWRYRLDGKGSTGPVSLAEADKARVATVKSWRTQLGKIKLEMAGAEGTRIANLVRSNVAYVLVNRDGPAIHPGSRNYARAWMRDGSLMAAALLRFGRTDEVKAFLEYYSPYIHDDGYVPCIVDKRGGDTVPEHDSHGEYIYLLAEYYRFTHDEATLKKFYPVAMRVAGYMERMVSSNRKPEYLASAGIERGFYGLMSPSISHEGYAQPEHSYWDDFMALKGLQDASELSEAVGKSDEAARLSGVALQFQTNLNGSITYSASFHKKNYIPGCVEFGDFDATSTSIGISPGGFQEVLPEDLLKGTYEKYWKFCEDRISGKEDWKDYTPYEMRSLSTFVRIGQTERALTLLKFFMHDTRPTEWNHWAEVVHRKYREPKYIGDMPHTWCGAEFLRSIRDFFVYEGGNGGLVVGAGISKDWLQGKGLFFTLPTAYGTLSLRARWTPGKGATYQLSGTTPPNGIMVMPPGGHGRKVSVASLPAIVHFD